jgi:hypothetical protein
MDFDKHHLIDTVAGFSIKLLNLTPYCNNSNKDTNNYKLKLQVNNLNCNPSKDTVFNYPPPSRPDTFLLKLNDEVRINDGSLKLKLKRIREDRCPIDFPICITPGWMDFTFQITANDNIPIDFNFSHDLDRPDSPKYFENYRFQIVSKVLPEPVYDRTRRIVLPINSNDYVVPISIQHFYN